MNSFFEGLKNERSTDGNQPMAEKKSWNRDFDSVFGTIFRISKCFQRSKQKLILLTEKAARNLEQ
jgi:hypothetical protein